MALKVLIVTILLSLCITLSEGRTSSYYDLVNAINEGKDLYAILEVTSDSDIKDIRKSFRKLASQYHPDKASEQQKYLDVTFAYEVLTDEAKRKEYDDLVQFGTPQLHSYYARYAYRYGAPNVDAEYVILAIVIVISSVQYVSAYQRHVRATEGVKRTLRYKTQVEQAQAEGRETPEIHIYGAEKPKLTDLLAIKLIMLPYLLPKAIYSFFTSKPLTEEEIAEKIMKEHGLTREEYEAEKAKNQRRYEQFLTSTKAKRYRRFMKKN